MRQARVERQTKETQITAKIDLDGTGRYDVTTGLGFLDHMIEQLARHSLIDIELDCEGDLHIDGHHTTEDCGIVLGKAVANALEDRAGIRRYGHAYIPMDETLTRCALEAFAQHAGITLHVENLYGVNNHHIVESSFKALARALRQAVEIDPRLDGEVASTKGSLI